MRWKVQSESRVYTCETFSVSEAGSLVMVGAYDEYGDFGAESITIHAPASILARPATEITGDA